MSDTPRERMARFLWLPPGARPPRELPRRQEIVFLLVGTTILFSGYDFNVYGLAIPQIQKTLNIPEDMVSVTVTFFRVAALAALFVAPLADLFGRRRMLLITVFGEAIFSVASGFARTYEQYVVLQVLTRIFGYSEEVLCFVVIAEEIDARVRGWSIGVLGAMNATGAGVASIGFAAVNLLPYGWRALYVIGGGALLILAYFRRLLPETGRFELRKAELAAMGSRTGAALDTLKRLIREHPGRLAAMTASAGAFGFAIGPATILMSKYLQQTHHYQPFQVTLLYLFGGLVSVVGNILAGRISDRLGRKRVLFVSVLICGMAFAVFFSGIEGWVLPVSWIVAIFGYLAADALMSGYPAEIFPTAYRSTAGTLRYFASVLGGMISLALEGPFYDWLGAHGPATMLALAAIPVTLFAILYLPETARRTLEEISG